jgi:hypothetical protein
MKTMKAVVKYENKAYATELREVPIPKIGPILTVLLSWGTSSLGLLSRRAKT